MAEERPIWGIHMDREFGTRPVEQGFVRIGWPDVGDLAKLSPTREAFKLAVGKAYPKTKPGAVPVVAGNLFKFAIEMKAGDRVIYPSKVDRKINLGALAGSYQFAPSSDDIGCPNLHKVKWLHQFDRTGFSQSALYEIGSAVTLFQVKNNAEEFLAAFEGSPLPGVEVDDETGKEAFSTAEEATEDFILKRLKSALTPYEFEKFVAHLLERMGYHARVTQQSVDGGVDIIAHKDELGFEGPLIKVQCKQTLDSIGQPAVSQLYGHVDPREYGLFVSLGEYTNQAKQFERSKQNLRLIDGAELITLIANHYERFEPRYQMLLPLKRVYVPSVSVGDSVFD